MYSFFINPPKFKSYFSKMLLPIWIYHIYLILSIEYMYIFTCFNIYIKYIHKLLTYQLRISTELSKPCKSILEINSWVSSDNTSETVGIQEEFQSLWANRWLTHPQDYKDNIEHSNLCCVFLISNGTIFQSHFVPILYVSSSPNQSRGLVGSYTGPEINSCSLRETYFSIQCSPMSFLFFKRQPFSECLFVQYFLLRKFLL